MPKTNGNEKIPQNQHKYFLYFDFVKVINLFFYISFKEFKVAECWGPGYQLSMPK